LEIEFEQDYLELKVLALGVFPKLKLWLPKDIKI